jgi:lipopolysaccharide biosynthesis regulator YciM
MNDPSIRPFRKARFGAFNVAGERVASFELNREKSTFEGSGSIDILKELECALIACGARADRNTENLLEAFNVSVAPLDLTIERIPDEDIYLNIEIDFAIGMIAGRAETSQGVPPLPASIRKQVAESIFSVHTRIANDLAESIEGCGSDPVAAAYELGKAYKHGLLKFRPTDRLAAAVNRVDPAALDDQAARDFLTRRLMILTRLNSYQDAGRDAGELLRRWSDHRPELDAELRSIQASAHADAGRVETAITVWSSLTKRPDLSSGQRAQFLRNLSFTCSDSDPRALAWMEQSTDAYLQAGERQEAARNVIQWGEMLEHHDTGRALAVIDRAASLLDGDGHLDQALRAALQYVRASRLAALERPSEALEAAVASVEARRRLAGQEDELLSSLALAEGLASQTGDPRAADFAREVEELKTEISSRRFELSDKIDGLIANWDEATATELRETARLEISPIQIATKTALIARDPALATSDRLAALETLHSHHLASGVRTRFLAPVRLAIAGTLVDEGELKRASTWLDMILADDPLASGIADYLIDLLARSHQWPTAVVVARRELTLKGDNFKRAFTLARVAGEAGYSDEALRAALTANEHAVTLEETAAAQKVMQLALKDGGKRPTQGLKSAGDPVTGDEFEEALCEFGRMTSADVRMEYWKKPKGADDYEWITGPERFAQVQLRTWLNAKFGERITIFEEISVGAGRLDLIVCFAGGMEVIVELKMLGFRYSSTYAARGEDQILHYMEARDRQLGYLIAFDGRVDNNGDPLISSTNGGATVREILIDVCPRVRRPRTTAG